MGCDWVGMAEWMTMCMAVAVAVAVIVGGRPFHRSALSAAGAITGIGITGVLQKRGCGT